MHKYILQLSRYVPIPLILISVINTSSLQKALLASDNTFERSFHEYDIYEVDIMEAGAGCLIVGEDGFSETY